MAVIKHVDPISRIEGHLGVRLNVDDTANPQRVLSADVHGNLWRGFENFLLGRNPNDAITFTQRICGVCPVPHGQASTFAIENVYGYNNGFQTFMAGGTYTPSGSNADVTALPAGMGVPAKALHIRNLVLSAEYLMSHITHFYHLAAPSYVQGPNMPPWTPYWDSSFYHPLLLSAGHGTDGAAGTGVLPLEVDGFSKDLWSAVIKQYVKALRIRRLTFEAGALFAGRMPMTSCFIAGGVTDDHTEDLSAKCALYYTMLKEVGTFIVKEYVPLVLALGALYPNYDNLVNAQLLASVDFVTAISPDGVAGLWELASAENVNVVPSLANKNTNYGGGVGNFLSWGAFPQSNGQLGLRRGYKIGAGAVTAFTASQVQTLLTEDITKSRYANSAAGSGFGYETGTNVEFPGNVSRTIPERNTAAKYSWIKAPRISSQPMEVGPFARMVVAGLIDTTETVTYATSVGAAYTAYKAAGVTGLKPSMVEADLAVALVRTGLANLVSGGVTYGVGAGETALPADKTAIVNAYTAPGAYIGGIAAVWILNIKGGLSTMDRLRGRALESLTTVVKMIGAYPFAATLAAAAPGAGGWIQELDGVGATDPTFATCVIPQAEVSGFGATEAPRGALMHLVTIKANVITKYQAVVPTTWNASPKDASLAAGPMEKAMEGIPYSIVRTSFTGGGGTVFNSNTSTDATYKAGGGVEALRVAQSFDPCIACAVH